MANWRRQRGEETHNTVHRTIGIETTMKYSRLLKNSNGGYVQKQHSCPQSKKTPRCLGEVYTCCDIGFVITSNVFS